MLSRCRILERYGQAYSRRLQVLNAHGSIEQRKNAMSHGRSQTQVAAWRKGLADREEVEEFRQSCGRNGQAAGLDDKGRRRSRNVARYLDRLALAGEFHGGFKECLQGPDKQTLISQDQFRTRRRQFEKYVAGFSELSGFLNRVGQHRV